MWIELCEGDEIEMSDSYKELVSDIGDEEVDGVEFIVNFYKILDRFIDNKLIEFEGGDIDWVWTYFDNCGIGGDEFSNCFDKYNLG
jgi:hypothetical protein